MAADTLKVCMRVVGGLRRRVPACRAVQRIVTDGLIPWRETYTDFRLGVMDFAIYLPVVCPDEKRAVPDLYAVW